MDNLDVGLDGDEGRGGLFGSQYCKMSGAAQVALEKKVAQLSLPLERGLHYNIQHVS